MNEKLEPESFILINFFWKLCYTAYSISLL